MWRKVLKTSAHPRALLKSVLALDDSPHAIAVGVAIGVFIGLTPTVGIQTVLVLALVFLTRKFFYFNGSAAMAATYISNPFTMLPMYYFWYKLGTWFLPGSMSFEELSGALKFDGLGSWWSSMSALGVEVGSPMLIGALLTAPIGVLIAYPLTYFLVKWARTPPSAGSPTREESPDDRVDSAHPASQLPDGTANTRTPTESARVQNL